MSGEDIHMSMLDNNKIIAIATDVATANNINFKSIVTSSTTDSTGAEAIEIKFVLNPGSTEKIAGLPSALTTSQVIQKLADAGEERFSMVRFEGPQLVPPSA
jgi:hypothetical protein